MTNEEIVDGNRAILCSQFHEYELPDRTHAEHMTQRFYLNVLRYHKDIAWLWPVISRIRAFAAQEQNHAFAKPWLAIAMELYKVPLDDFTELYRTVVFFIKCVKGATPASGN